MAHDVAAQPHEEARPAAANGVGTDAERLRERIDVRIGVEAPLHKLAIVRLQDPEELFDDAEIFRIDQLIERIRARVGDVDGFVEPFVADSQRLAPASFGN